VEILFGIVIGWVLGMITSAVLLANDPRWLPTRERQRRRSLKASQNSDHSASAARSTKESEG
jgi:hypothetical protein